MEARPGSTQLAGGSEARTFGDLFQAERGRVQELVRQGHPQAGPIVGEAHARLFAKKARQVPGTRAGEASDGGEAPRFRGVRGHRILGPVNRGVKVIAPLEPR